MIRYHHAPTLTLRTCVELGREFHKKTADQNSQSMTRATATKLTTETGTAAATPWVEKIATITTPRATTTTTKTTAAATTTITITTTK